MRPSPYPDEAVVGPVVALTNEHAGSDGDIFSHNFKLMGLGPLVGTRTWGGVVGIWPRHTLVDGTQTTQPEFSFWFNDVGFGVENYGTDPQIEVDNAPQDARAGRDRQLETALATALDLIEKTQARRAGVRRAAGGDAHAVAGAQALAGSFAGMMASRNRTPSWTNAPRSQSRRSARSRPPIARAPSGPTPIAHGRRAPRGSSGRVRSARGFRRPPGAACS